MSRSVSAPSSVTKTSPCWNGLIVPGSTLRYGSNFWSCTFRPRALSSRPSDAATIPLPSAETTPPVTKTYLGARALTGFEGSSDCGRTCSLGVGACLHQVVKATKCALRIRAPDGAPRRVDRDRHLRPVVAERLEVDPGADALVDELEGEATLAGDVHDEERPRGARPLEHPRPEERLPRQRVRPLDLPSRSWREAAAVGLDSPNAGPPVAEVVRLCDERPDVGDRSEDRLHGGVLRHQM